MQGSAFNANHWAWLEGVYNKTPLAGLKGDKPLARYQRDLPMIRQLGQRAARLDTVRAPTERLVHRQTDCRRSGFSAAV